MFALIDCNKFYASCEQVFRPDLRGKVVCVLSNNDGCIIAMSQEAKDAGVPPFAPYFKIKPMLDQLGATIFSSNYALYGDLSARVMQTLQSYASDIEIYSIDEVFLRPVECFGDLKSYAAMMRDAVWKQVRIRVGVGVASTKTLAKLANRAAKKIPSLNHVCIIENDVQREWLLRRTNVSDIWGVGKRLAERLNAIGIITGLDLASANPKEIRKQFNVCLERSVAELNGISCLNLEGVSGGKKQIYCTRAFGQKTNDINAIHEATASYAARAAEKLRLQNHSVKTMQVFLQTSPFDPAPSFNDLIINLPYPTNDTRVIVKYVRYAIDSIHECDIQYAKSGVGFIELVDMKFAQNDLFEAGQNANQDKAMALMDQVNKRFGRGTIFIGAQGTRKTLAMAQAHKSPSYTTSWNDLPKVRC